MLFEPRFVVLDFRRSRLGILRGLESSGHRPSDTDEYCAKRSLKSDSHIATSCILVARATVAAFGAGDVRVTRGKATQVTPVEVVL